MDTILRIFGFGMSLSAFTFIFNTYLTIWWNWPGATAIFGAADGTATIFAWIQVAIYVVPLIVLAAWAIRTRQRTLHADSEVLTNLAAFIARGAFWAIVLVGLADMLISFLRVEDLLPGVVGEELSKELGRSSFRGAYVHYPLMAVGFIIAFFSRSIGFIWLALLVVIAELQIVIFRFIFSYEQAFMADLVRFWYGGLFLFASAYTLLHEGHVRVDILYASLSPRMKAWSNAIGSLILGAPVCWVILERGLAEKGSIITSPMLNFEVTQAGFGMYVKYLMAGFLGVYAVSMLIQFMAYFLNSAGVLLQEPDAELPTAEEKHF